MTMTTANPIPTIADASNQMTQTILATVLPHGGDGTNLTVDLLITPRLSGAPTLASFDWVNWTRILAAGVNVTLQCLPQGAARSGTSLQSFPVTFPQPLNHALWATLFPPTTRVDLWSLPLLKSVVTYPTIDAVHLVSTIYQNFLPLTSVATQPAARSAGAQATTSPLFARGMAAQMQARVMQAPVMKAALVPVTTASGNTSFVHPTLAQNRVTYFTEGIRQLGILDVTQTANFTVGDFTAIKDHATATMQQATDYFTRGTTPATTHPTAPALDFSQRIGALTHYPSLLAALGLLWRVTVPTSFIPEGTGTLGIVDIRFTATWKTPPLVQGGQVATAYEHRVVRDRATIDGPGRRIFAAQPDPSGAELPVRDGFLVLDPQNYLLHDLDAQNALTQLGANVPTDAFGIPSSLPAQRSVGLFLTHRDLAPMYLNSQDRNKQWEQHVQGGMVPMTATPPATTVAPITAPEPAQATMRAPQPVTPHYAEDLTRGYRFDIWDDATKVWHSLHQRHIDLSPRGSSNAFISVAFTEEGFSELAVMNHAGDANDGSPSDATASDPTTSDATTSSPAGATVASSGIMMQWNGWSLSASRPSTPLSRHGNPNGQTDPNERDPLQQKTMNDDLGQGQQDLGRDVRVQQMPVPGTLPRLRFGRTYQARARAVDVSGASASLDAQAPDVCITAPLTYQRHEPVSAPIVLATNASTLLAPGSHLDRIVIRTRNRHTAPLVTDANPPTASLRPLPGVVQEMTPKTNVRVTAEASPLHVSPPQASSVRTVDNPVYGSTTQMVPPPSDISVDLPSTIPPTDPPDVTDGDRVVLPPRVPEWLVEQHGMLDGWGWVKNPDGTLTRSPAPTDKASLPAFHGATRDALAQRDAYTFPLMKDQPPTTPLPEKFASAPAAPLRVGTPPTYDLRVPYLPDPLAIGVGLQDLPGLSMGTHYVTAPLIAPLGAVAQIITKLAGPDPNALIPVAPQVRQQLVMRSRFTPQYAARNRFSQRVATNMAPAALSAFAVTSSAPPPASPAPAPANLTAIPDTQGDFSPLTLIDFGYPQGGTTSAANTAPGTPSDAAQGAWPNAQGMVLALRTGQTAATQWDPASRTLTAAMPPGMSQFVTMNSFADPRWLAATSAIWRYYVDMYHTILTQMEAAKDSGARQVFLCLCDLLLKGFSSPIMPSRTLELVHATQQPLIAPDIRHLAPTSLADDTITVPLVAKINAHGPSTAQVDLFGTWTVYHDDPASGTNPSSEITQGHVATFEVHGATTSTTLADPHSDASAANASSIGYYNNDLFCIMAGEGAGWESTFGQPPSHHFGDTKHHRVTYHATATSHYADCFASTDETTCAGAPYPVHIPSRTTPPALHVHSCLPAFAWTRTTQGAIFTSIRRSVIRVYLERPWFMTGDDEQVGVILPVSHFGPAPTPYATLWGNDPTLIQRSVTGGFTRDRFIWGTDIAPDADTAQWQVLPDAPHTLPDGTPVLVAGHTVAPDQYDAQRGLWRCDIAVNLDEIVTPFVRLGVARYQPYATARHTLSPVTLCDPVQLLPQRTLTVALDEVKGGKASARIHLDVPDRPRTHVFSAMVQRKVTGAQAGVMLSDDALWEDVPSADPPRIHIPGRDGTPDGTANGAYDLTMNLPSITAGSYRILVREYEPLPTDAGDTYPRLVYSEGVILDTLFQSLP